MYLNSLIYYKQMPMMNIIVNLTQEKASENNIFFFDKYSATSISGDHGTDKI